MDTWMQKLSEHYTRMRSAYPHDRLLLMFDIDGTIIDTRYMTLYLLKAYDREFGTYFFSDLNAGHITTNENGTKELLCQRGIPAEKHDNILRWCEKKRWTKKAVLGSHKPYQGVMEVIRWFQMQPDTHVALNTGRPEEVREETLLALNKLGEEFKVTFSDAFLYMNPRDWNTDCTGIKADGVRHFRRRGYRVIAFVDNEPENLKSISEMEGSKDILLLHADTIFVSQRRMLPAKTVRGKEYDLTGLIEETALPRHVQFVWHAVDDVSNLGQFLSSGIKWAECNVRLSPDKRNMVLRHEPFEKAPLGEDENLLFLEHVLTSVKTMNKSIKLDLKENGSMVDMVLDALEGLDFPGNKVWFNAQIGALEESDFRKIAKAYPSAIIQCPVDFLFPLILCAPEKAEDALSFFREWGINRFSLNWENPYLKGIMDQLDKWGFDLNVHGVPDLEAFLRAVLLLPRSITSDFNFPKWNYYGTGLRTKERPPARIEPLF